jgi:multiple sugar transport system substrate-binding protein
MKKFATVLLVVVLVVISLGSTGTSYSQTKPFEGVSIDVLTFTGPQIAEPLQRRAPEFKELTGASVNVIMVPFANLYQSILTDQTLGTLSYDAFVFAPQWMGDFVEAGILEDLTPYIAQDQAIQWDDIAPFFRNFSAMYKGNTYLIPLDGDFHMVYYRTDVFAEAGLEPPKTWDEYLADAEALNGKDMNGDGEPDYGSCIAKQRGQQGWQFFFSFASPFIQSLGTAQGAFFDTTTFKPLVNNDGFIRALDIAKETSKYGPPNEMDLDVGGTRDLFITGRCALSLDWGDIGTLAVDPTRSTVQDKVGAVITPGTTEVVDFATGKLVPCDEQRCPYAIDGVNHAPYASFGGWSGGISSGISQDKKDAAYAFFSYMSQPAQANVDVTIGETGFNPYRLSQFADLGPWEESGLSEKAANDYLGAIQASLNNPNMVLDLRVPQNQRYLQNVLDEVYSSFLAGEYTSQEAAQEIYNRWEEITNELGREQQLAAYLASLNIQK